MRLRYRRSFFYFALALPGILLPQFDFWGLNRTWFSLGWPLSGGRIQLIRGDSRILRIYPEIWLPLVAVAWTYIVSLAWRTRRWAMGRPDWTGAFVTAFLTSLYCALVFCFFHGLVGVIWEWQVQPMQAPELERALVFGRYWLPYLYALGAAAIFVTLFLDARLRPALQRLIHFAFALGFILMFWRLSPYLEWQLQNLDFLIQFVREHQR